MLLTKLRHVHAGGDPAAYLVPDEALTGYMRHCATRIGDAYFRTPRETVKGFLDLLALLDQHPGIGWQPLLDQVDLPPVDPEADEPAERARRAPGQQDETSLDDELHTFRL